MSWTILVEILLRFKKGRLIQVYSKSLHHKPIEEETHSNRLIKLNLLLLKKKYNHFYQIICFLRREEALKKKGNLIYIKSLD